VEVRPIQTIRENFQPNKMARAFEKGCFVAKKGAKGPIFREICPLKKMTPKYNATSGIIAGELLTGQTGIYILSYKFVMNGAISMEVRFNIFPFL
jgi:hypothetical protein